MILIIILRVFVIQVLTMRGVYTDVTPPFRTAETIDLSVFYNVNDSIPVLFPCYATPFYFVTDRLKIVKQLTLATPPHLDGRVVNPRTLGASITKNINDLSAFKQLLVESLVV